MTGFNTQMKADSVDAIASRLAGIKARIMAKAEQALEDDPPGDGVDVIRSRPLKNVQIDMPGIALPDFDVPPGMENCPRQKDARAKPRRINTHTPIGRFRAERGITQADMAERLCVSQAALSLYEQGHRPIPRPVMKLFQHLAAQDGWDMESG